MSINAKVRRNRLWQFSVPRDGMSNVSIYTTGEINTKISSIQTQLSNLSSSLKSDLKDEATKYNSSIDSINKTLGELPSMLVDNEDFILKIAQKISELEK